MKIPRTCLTALLVLVVWCAQVVGLKRGFVCDCGGVEHVTAADHCHGPHDHDCTGEEHEQPAHDCRVHDEEEPFHEHQALVEALQAEKASAAAFLVPVATVLFYLLTDDFFSRSLFPARSDKFDPPRPDSRAGPFWPPRLSRSIALLI
ncbi:MAG: hypothetical protein JNG86_16385 [Verrucomicrobiaceae bacterium]|nr:hypothetical protein [Verrucomicrobiaceae bacterium]